MPKNKIPIAPIVLVLTSCWAREKVPASQGGLDDLNGQNEQFGRLAFRLAQRNLRSNTSNVTSDVHHEIESEVLQPSAVCIYSTPVLDLDSSGQPGVGVVGYEVVAGHVAACNGHRDAEFQHEERRDVQFGPFATDSDLFLSSHER